jgi:hypothetical protein
MPVKTRWTMRLVVLAVVLTLAAVSPSWSETQTLVVHVSHHPHPEESAALKDALERACALPSMKCSLGTPLEATTFLRVSAQEVPVQPPPPGGRMFTGFVDIKSRVMMPGSVSAQATSLDRLAVLLLTSVKRRHAERAGVIEVPSGGVAR